MRKINKSLLITLGGTAIAAVVPIVFTPIIAKLYSSSSYGEYAYFLATSNVICVFFAGKYDMAILIPRDEKEANNVFSLSVLLSGISLIILYIFIVLTQNFNSIWKAEISDNIFLLPIATFFSVLNQIILTWKVRLGEFTKISINKIANSLSYAFLAIILVKIGFEKTGLIFSLILSMAFTTFLVGFTKIKEVFFSTGSLKDIILASKKYINFPKYNIPSSFIETLSLQLPIYLITYLYDIGILGQYAMAQRLILLPVTFVISSIVPVFRHSAAKEIHETGRCIKSFNSYFVGLTICACIIFPILYLLISFFLEDILGAKWLLSIDLMKILIFSVFIRFITNPLSSVIILKEKQKLDLILQIFLILAVGSAFFIAYLRKANITDCILYFVFVYILKYIIELIIAFNLARKYESINS
ncbi:lipopolysaccharide biosynthesis protein [Emticicia sp. C21]|uniref:lipopolysaccharide biosynthesis protein n=1 Tax=Emticicia sp. C21 TaxID=2302915 RepID=UPI000E341440|nr:oligosaccharide flippase family protein [Emticicia sp. C21]RFS17240.1 hypothetical protein D0T08_05525 [Emticicia sp. C21]